MLEKWKNGFWVNDKIRVDDKTKNGQHLFKNQPSSIPLFHSSINEANVQTSKDILYFH
jgi:hypothetical protein